MSGFPKNCVYVILACCKDLIYNREAPATNANGEEFYGEIVPMVIKVGKTDDSHVRFSKLEKEMGLSRIERVAFIKSPPEGVTACERALKKSLGAHNLKVGIRTRANQFKRMLEMFSADAGTLELANKFLQGYPRVERNAKYITNSVHDPYDLLDKDDTAAPLEVSDSIPAPHLRILKGYTLPGNGVAPPASPTANAVLKIYFPEAYPKSRKRTN